MGKSVIVGLTVLLIVIIAVPSVLAWASATENFLFSDSIEVWPFMQRHSGYAANITDGERRIGSIFVRADYYLNSSVVPIVIQIAHQDWTEIDSIKIEFTPIGYTTIYLDEFPSAGKGTVFQPSEDKQKIIFSMDDLGWAGKHSVRLLFRVQLDKPENAKEARFNFSMELLMHRQSAWQITALKAQTSIDQPMIIHPGLT